MDVLKEKIRILKDKILNEIESFGYYNEFKYVKDILLNELNSYHYDENNEFELKKYYAWLLEFFEGRIEVINKRIIDNENDSVFDNSSLEHDECIQGLEKEIEEKLDYVTNNYIGFDSIVESYNKLKKDYQEEYQVVLNNTKKRFDSELGLIDEPIPEVITVIFDKEYVLPKEPVLSLYKDIESLRESYIRGLICFNQVYDNIRLFIEKDKEIKKVFEKAYDVITDQEICEVIKNIENDYHNGINNSISNGLMFLGPEQIQDKMTDACNKIEELTEKEIEKNKYHRIISEMTLNTDAYVVLNALNYIETNHLFEEEFYYNLYYLVEYEKYLVNRFRTTPKLYPELGVSIKNSLEKKFIDRLSECSEDDASKMIDLLKKYGYEKVVDLKCKEFFDKQDLTNNQEFDIDEGKCTSWRGMQKYYNLNVMFSNRVDMHITPIMKGDKVYHFSNAQKHDGNSPDYFYIERQFCEIAPEEYFIINRETGKCTRIPHRIGTFPSYNFGYFYHGYRYKKYKEKNWIYDFYNEKFELIKRFEETDSVYADCVRKCFIMNRFDNQIEIYNQNLELEKTFNLNDLLDDARIRSANDGVMVIKSDEKVMYYDYVNMKVIDSFKDSKGWHTTYGYSEGLYDYRDDNEKYGYKNINGEVVLPPIYDVTAPFLCNVAPVYINEQGEGVINKLGEFIPEKELYAKVREGRERFFQSLNYPNSDWYNVYYYLDYPNHLSLCRCYKNGMYRIDYKDDTRFGSSSSKGYLVVKDHYHIDVDLPIKDIDFDKKEKVIKKQ